MSTPPFRVKAVYDYNSAEGDDLNFPNGQIVTVTDEEDADWYYGEYSDTAGVKHQGLFPKNFVERYEPATPPRPSRPARAKKDAEPISHIQDPPEQPKSEAQESNNTQSTSGLSIPPIRKLEDQPFQAPASDTQSTTKPLSKPQTSHTVVSTQPADKPAVVASSKVASPPAADKPSGNAFRDRIAAFNKSTAPPPAPMKPSGLGQSAGSSFVKKPYVPPPPSRNAYVPIAREPPPQKVYRREEDPDVAEQVSNNEAAGAILSGAATTSGNDVDEDQPKPTSLKERIALLQKQQMEQAARHADGPKKEKPQRPPKKRMESHQNLGAASSGIELENSEQVRTEESAGALRGEQSSEDRGPRARSATRHQTKSKEATPLASPTRESFNDPNDADQSGAGETGESGEISAERDDSDEKPRARKSLPFQPAVQTPAHVPSSLAEQDAENEDDEEEEDEDEEEVDPEVKRKMEIRERMAKMSGGMGMAGMFGPPGGLPMMGVKKVKTSGSSARDTSSEQTRANTNSSITHDNSVMALPGMQRVRSPEEAEKRLEVAKDEEQSVTTINQGQGAEDVPDIEETAEEIIPPPRRSEERGVPPSIPQGRTAPGPPPTYRAPPPSQPPERALPPRVPPPDSRPVPPLPLNIPKSPSIGSESDEEMSLHPEGLEPNTDPSDTRPISRDAPSVPFSVLGVPPRPQGPRSPASQHAERAFDPTLSMNPAIPASPSLPNAAANRSSRIPPIPSSTPSIAPTPQSRAPPPPPPQAPVSRRQTGDNKNFLEPPPRNHPQDSDEEVTEYDGDYDTHVASNVPYRDPLRSQIRIPSADDSLTGDEAAYHHEGLPSIGPPPGPPPSSAPRAIPPPPPNQPPKHTRQSSDMPRMAPPPPRPPKEVPYEDDDRDYESYENSGPLQAASAIPRTGIPVAPSISRVDDRHETYQVTLPQQYPSSPPMPAPTAFPSSPSFAPPMPRQSLDVHRTTSTRRSMDNARPSMEQGFIADDVDLGRGSQWWLQRKMPPPVFQNRTDISFEMDETSVSQQGGGQSTVKNAYILFMDYSQTVITARYDIKDPSKVEFQQRHEPPPLGLRQDQLEGAHVKFGARIAEKANTKLNHTVGDGSPSAFITELLSALPAALPPVGTRAYGALVYTNLANATVQQNDEIRAGDIVSFRNAKLQGHRGPVKQKYNIDVGKPDHVAVVVDWDGTKKKVRAWEQGRESKKVKIESFKLGDLKSGEVKVWRVMAREWVGWGGGHS
ncbi:hypothetical protein MMC13_008018 [Lambiella insularis]|nr:hypothetical protein [Lambiella insularis]